MVRRNVLRVLASTAVAAAAVALTPALSPAASPVSGRPGLDAAERQLDAAERQLIADAERDGAQDVIVELRRLSDQEPLLQSLRDAGTQFTVQVRYHRFPMISMRAGRDTLELLSSSDLVVTVHPDADGFPTLASSVPLINADDVHGYGFTGTGQTIAVLDTGVDTDHPFLANRVVAEACFSYTHPTNPVYYKSLCPNGQNSQDGPGATDPTVANCLSVAPDGTQNICAHGTHVAGIAAGAAAGVNGAPGNGVAPGADIIAVQVFSRREDLGTCPKNKAPCVVTRLSDTLSGMQYVLDLSTTHTIAAVNMSLGFGPSSSTCDVGPLPTAVNNLFAAGIATVAATGNNGSTTEIHAPACVSTAVAVGNTYDNDAIAADSNRNALLDLFAPGTNIDSSIPGNAWGTDSGTSMSAPHVAGAFAVLRQALPGETVTQLLTRLQGTGVPITFSSGNQQITRSRIDLLAAITPALPQPTAEAGGPYNTSEGTAITLAASATNATGGFTWDFDNDGSYDDATGANPIFPLVGQDGVHTVKVQVTGPGGVATDQATVVVTNAIPLTTTSIVSSAKGGGNKGGGYQVTIQGTVTDPGWLDPLSATVNWGDGTSSPAPGTLENNAPNATLTFTATHTYSSVAPYTIIGCGTDDDTTICQDAA